MTNVNKNFLTLMNPVVATSWRVDSEYKITTTYPQNMLSLVATTLVHALEQYNALETAEKTIENSATRLYWLNEVCKQSYIFSHSMDVYEMEGTIETKQMPNLSMCVDIINERPNAVEKFNGSITYMLKELSVNILKLRKALK